MTNTLVRIFVTPPVRQAPKVCGAEPLAIVQEAETILRQHEDSLATADIVSVLQEFVRRTTAVQLANVPLSSSFLAQVLKTR
jgi:hypothetical protein